MPPGGGGADHGEHFGAGARGASQVRGVKAGDGRLDARRQIPRSAGAASTRTRYR